MLLKIATYILIRSSVDPPSAVENETRDRLQRPQTDFKINSAINSFSSLLCVPTCFVFQLATKQLN